MSALLLSRIQFAITVGFHILFPALNIGLAVFIAIMEGVWLKTRDPKFYQIIRFWTRLFALTFGMGVVSGIVMSYELGTNFGRFTQAIGGVLGPLFGYEVLSAFFLEAGFLGVMLFGWNKVAPKWHYAATLFVAIGTVISAFWILSANSWMQYPAGYQVVDGKFEVTNWMQAIFNPTMLPRFFHMLMASFTTSAFVLAGVAAWYLIKQRELETAKPVFSFALGAAVILVPLQIWLGDVVGLSIYKYQPLKTAAIEGLWETQQGAPLVLFGIPDEKQRKNLYSIEIPYGASLFNTHSLKGTLQGLNTASPSDWPVIGLTFYSFRVMVGTGLLFLVIALFALFLRFRKKLFDNKPLQYLCIFAAPLGFVATIAGWITAESGRQPWVVYGMLRTSDSVSMLEPSHVLISLILFIVIYGIIFGFYCYYLFKLIRQGASHAEAPPLAAYMQRPNPEGL